MKKDIAELLDSLGKSKFRGSFHLNRNMKEYIKEKGLDKIKSDAKDLIIKRISDAYPKNDGKQTPMRQVHPVFIAEGVWKEFMESGKDINFQKKR